MSVGTNWPAWRISDITIEAVLAWQHDIQDHHIDRWRSPLNSSSAASPESTTCDLITFGFQIEAQAFGQVLLILHDQNASHLATGNCSTNVLPRPGPSLSAQARPPCRRATERTMYRPKPVPFTRVASGPGTR